MIKSANIFKKTSINFQKYINALDTALKLNMDLLIHFLGFDRAAVYLLENLENKESLRPRQTVTIHGEMLGEGENLLNNKKNSSLSNAFKKNKIVICSKGPEFSINLPLTYNNRKIGVLRADNFISKKPVSKKQISGIKEFIEIFTTGIFNAVNFKHYNHEVDKLRALTRISNYIGRALKINDILKKSLLSLVKDMGFDRVQLYLLDDNNNAEIKENMSVDFRGHFSVLEDTSNILPLFDSLKPYRSSKNLIAFIPLSYNNKTTGLLIVDNFFSRQIINDHDLSFLRSFADHLSTIIENSRLFEKVEKLSITDGLTGLFNHRYFYERLNEEVSRSERFNSYLSLIMLDIDHFKKFNDTYGHQAGDKVLTAVSKIIHENIRGIDVASRYGGEEITIILPGTDREGARIIAERIRQSIAAYEFRKNKNIVHITVSMGIVCYPIDTKDKTDLVSKADHALYWVKNHGRNGICSYSRFEEF